MSTTAAMQQIIEALEHAAEALNSLRGEKLRDQFPLTLAEIGCALSAARAMQVQEEGVPAVVYEAATRTSSLLFASQDAANAFAASLPNTVSGAMSITPRPVIGSASPAVSALKGEAPFGWAWLEDGEWQFAKAFSHEPPSNVTPLFLASPSTPSALEAAKPVAPGKRTDADYAIEHAEYMAVDAERLIAAVNDLATAEQEREDGTANPSDVDAARESVSEAQSSLRNGIYEYRKRRDRALASPTAPAPATQPDEWTRAQAICDLPAVDEAIRNLIEDNTGDNAACLVREVLRASPSPEALEAAPSTMANALRAVLADPVIDGMSARIRNQAADDGRHDTLAVARAALSGVAAPATQPTDEALAVLQELVALKDLKADHAQAAYQCKVRDINGDGAGAVEALDTCSRIQGELYRREDPAWQRARELVKAHGIGSPSAAQQGGA